eukprot:scaffold128885_cov41-Tisochrysis_lutea.AAC.1
MSVCKQRLIHGCKGWWSILLLFVVQQRRWHVGHCSMSHTVHLSPEDCRMRAVELGICESLRCIRQHRSPDATCSTGLRAQAGGRKDNLTIGVKVRSKVDLTQGQELGHALLG